MSQNRKYLIKIASVKLRTQAREIQGNEILKCIFSMSISIPVGQLCLVHERYKILLVSDQNEFHS